MGFLQLKIEVILFEVIFFNGALVLLMAQEEKKPRQEYTADDLKFRKHKARSHETKKHYSLMEWGFTWLKLIEKNGFTLKVDVDRREFFLFVFFLSS